MLPQVNHPHLVVVLFELVTQQRGRVLYSHLDDHVAIDNLYKETHAQIICIISLITCRLEGSRRTK